MTFRLLLAKPGLDGHDRGVKVVARALRDAGYEIIYTGLHQTPDMIVRTALQEDVSAIGLSILSGAHSTLVPRVRKLLIEEGLGDIPLVVGGIVPAEDAQELLSQGVSAVFGPGTALADIVRFFDEAVGRTP